MKNMGIKLATIQRERLTHAQAFVKFLIALLIAISELVSVSLSVGGFAMTYKEEFASSPGKALLIAIPTILIGPQLTVFFNSLKQTLFDIIVKTVVVKGSI